MESVRALGKNNYSVRPPLLMLVPHLNIRVQTEKIKNKIKRSGIKKRLTITNCAYQYISTQLKRKNIHKIPPKSSLSPRRHSK